MKHIVCYSGGHSSALVAIEAVRRYGRDAIVLLNHDISSAVEHPDIKRFKQEVADYLNLKITYANVDNFEKMTPLDVCIQKRAFQVGNGQAFCTSVLKTEPFMQWLDENYPVTSGKMREDIDILYGFDMDEEHRIQRRVGVMGTQGYKTDYPLALWNRTIFDTAEIGIDKPITYKIFKHANCIGCLKAGKQHWYIVYLLYPELFRDAVAAEKEIGYTIIKDTSLEELIPKYQHMQNCNICPNDRDEPNAFWARVADAIPEQTTLLPCDCSI